MAWSTGRQWRPNTRMSRRGLPGTVLQRSRAESTFKRFGPTNERKKDRPFSGMTKKSASRLALTLPRKVTIPEVEAALTILMAFSACHLDDKSCNWKLTRYRE